MADLRDINVALLTQSHAFASVLKSVFRRQGIDGFSYAVRNFDFFNGLDKNPASILVIDEARGSTFGLETLAHYRAKTVHETTRLPVVYLTRDGDSFQRAKSLGAIRTLIKPTSPLFIAETIVQCLGYAPNAVAHPQPVQPDGMLADNVVSIFDHMAL